MAYHLLLKFEHTIFRISSGHVTTRPSDKAKYITEMNRDICSNSFAF